MQDSLLDYTKHYAVFYDDNGNYHGRKRIKKDSSVFSYCGRSYVFRPFHSTFFKDTGMIWKTRYYHYHVNNPEPLIIKQNYKPFMTASQFNIVIETDALKKLNDLANESLLSKIFTAKNIIIGLIAIAIIYFGSTTSWFGLTGSEVPTP